MNIDGLLGLGFARNEAKVYLELARTGSAHAGDLIKRTGLYKNGVYYALRRLMDRGLVSSVIVDGVAQFLLEPAESLLDDLEKEACALEERRKRTSAIVSEVRAIKQTRPSAQQTHMLIGVAGVKQMHRLWLEQNVPYVSFGVPPESIEIMGEHYWRNMHQKQKAMGLKGKLLLNSSLKSWAKGMQFESENRFLADAFEPLTQTTVFGDVVTIIVWSPQPILTMIKDPQVARSYEHFFEILWKQAEK